jgi:CheY-like chemotaxis protein
MKRGCAASQRQRRLSKSTSDKVAHDEIIERSEMISWREALMAKKVLVVDDELDMRIFITTLLETNGFKPLSAEDGFQGLEIARKSKPSLIILDIMMPRESGINMYRELRTDPSLKDIPVIMLSALSKKTFFHSQKVLDEYRGEKVPEPAFYIEKPPEPDELLEAIRKSLT